MYIVTFQGFAYVPRDELVSLVANEFRIQLSRALAVSVNIIIRLMSYWCFLHYIILITMLVDENERYLINFFCCVAVFNCTLHHSQSPDCLVTTY